MKATMQQRMARIMLMLSLCVLFAVVLLSLFRIAFLDKQLQADVGNPGNPAAQRTIFLGTTGVSWDLVNPATAPNLLRAATSEQAKVANLVVKVQADTTCPDSGWLTLNTGVRTIGLAQADEQCRHLPIIKANHRTWQIADWEQYLVANDGNKYQPKFGNLAQVLAANSQQIGVIGAGAALAMGNESGNIGDSAIQLKSGMAGANLKTGMQQTKVQYFQLAPVQAGKARLVTAADNAVGKRNSDVVQLQNALAKLADAQMVIADLGAARNDAPLAAHGKKDPQSASALSASFHPPASPGAALANDVAQIDRRFALVLDELRRQDDDFSLSTGKIRRTQIIFASLGEADRTGAKMQAYFSADLADIPDLPVAQQASLPNSAAIKSGAAIDSSELAFTNSTRIAGVVQSTDLLPTLAANANSQNANGMEVDLKNAVGAPITNYLGKNTPGSQIAKVIETGIRAEAVRSSLGFAFVAFSVLVVILSILAVLILRRREGALSPIITDPDRETPTAPRGLGKLRFEAFAAAPFVHILLLTCGAIPVSSFLINLFSWWYLPFSAFTSLFLILFLAWVIAQSIWQISRKMSTVWRITTAIPEIAPSTIAVALIALITVLTLTLDVIGGSYLHFSSIFGVQAQHAGRFYGFGNSAFVIFALSMLILTAFGLHLMRIASAANTYRYLFVTVMLALAVYVDGSPMLGADFGGPPAMICAFLVLLLLHLGRRLNRRSVFVFLLLGLASTVGIAILDWLRPARKRTHLGKFIESVLQGDFFPVVSRKLAGWFTDVSGIVWLLVIFFAVCGIWKLRHFSRVRTVFHAQDLTIAGKVVLPADFLACQIAILMLLIFGLAINDSGLLLPFIGLVYGLPLGFALAFGTLLDWQQPNSATEA